MFRLQLCLLFFIKTMKKMRRYLFCMNKPYFYRIIFVTDWRHKRLKNNRSTVILRRALLWIFGKWACWELKTFKILKFLKYSLRRTMCNLSIFTTLVSLSPGILRAQGIFRNLPNMYDGLFFTESCVTLVYWELQAFSEPCQISMMVNFIHSLV